jgi:hypothetical protein
VSNLELKMFCFAAFTYGLAMFVFLGVISKACASVLAGAWILFLLLMVIALLKAGK